MDLVQLQWQQFIVLFIINISLELCTQVWQINKFSSTPTNYNTLILQLTQKLQLFPATKPSCKYSSSCNYSEVATFYCQRMCCNQWVYCCTFMFVANMLTVTSTSNYTAMLDFQKQCNLPQFQDSNQNEGIISVSKSLI